MYKTTAEVKSTRTELVTVELNESKDNVEIYVRNATDCSITSEAVIGLSPEGFIDLVYPIIQQKGYRLLPAPEGF